MIPLFSASANEGKYIICIAYHFLFLDTLQKHQNVLTVCTVEGKDYPIQASTRDEMLMWIKAIEDVVVSLLL